MLGRLRPVVSPYIASAARRLSVLPAYAYTLAGFAASLAYLVALASGFPAAALLLLALGGVFDAVDGAVARLRGEASPRGALLDSTLDRAADAAYIYGLRLAGMPDPLVYLFLSSSLMISYVRARYESLGGGSLEGVGIVERPERLMLTWATLAAWLAYRPLGVGLLAFSAGISTLGLVQRFAAAYRRLSSGRARSPGHR